MILTLRSIGVRCGSFWEPAEARPDTRSRGFSLIEMLVVLAITVILAGIAVLSHAAVRAGLDLSLASRQVVMDLKLTRMHAVARNVNYRVVFASNTAHYQLQHKRGAAYVDDGTAVSLPAGIVIADCTANNDAIAFRPRGNAASFGTVTLRDRSGDTRRVIVDIAGRIRVQ